MAGITIGGRALVNTIAMTGIALNSGVQTGQREVGPAVVKGDVGPFSGVMATSTLRAELAVMFVASRMATVTVFGCTLIDPIAMTGLALERGVGASERESGFGMVEGHILPAAGVMAGFAGRAELAVVLIAGCMTGETIFRRAFIGSIGMAGLALNIRV